MTYEDFKEALYNYKFVTEKLYELADLGFDLIDGHYAIFQEVDNIFFMMIESEFGEEGRESVYEYIDDSVGGVRVKFTSDKKLWKYLQNFRVDRVSGLGL